MNKTEHQEADITKNEDYQAFLLDLKAELQDEINRFLTRKKKL